MKLINLTKVSPDVRSLDCQRGEEHFWRPGVGVITVVGLGGVLELETGEAVSIPFVCMMGWITC
jgi:hypothetical protein